MDETDYLNILSAIKKLEKEVDKLEKRVMRHQMILSVPQASTEEEK